MSKQKNKKLFTPEQLEQVAARFKALGEPMRLRIVEAVCQGPRSVSDIVEATGSTQANVSKHLSLLAAAGILIREKDGQRVFYGLKDTMILKLCELVHADMEK